MSKPQYMKSNVSLRPVREDDKPLLFHIYASSRTEELKMTGWNDEQKQPFLKMQFTAQQQDYSKRFPFAEQSIILENEVPAGRIWINRSDTDIRLLDVTLLPKYQNTGIGTLLLSQLQDEAKISGRKLHHAVYKDNIDALRFYERLGFSIVEDYDTYCVMEWINNTR